MHLVRILDSKEKALCLVFSTVVHLCIMFCCIFLIPYSCGGSCVRKFIRAGLFERGVLSCLLLGYSKEEF